MVQLERRSCSHGTNVSFISNSASYTHWSPCNSPSHAVPPALSTGAALCSKLLRPKHLSRFEGLRSIRAPAAPHTSWHWSTERHLACINMDVDFEKQGNKCWRIDGMGRVALEDGLGRLERTSVKHVCHKCWRQFTQSCNYARHRKKCRLSAVCKVRWIKSTCPFPECQGQGHTVDPQQ